MALNSLRHRITVGLLLYAAGLSAALLVAGVILGEHHERKVWNNLLTDVLVRDLQAAGIAADELPTPSVRLVDLDSPAAADLPADVQRLGPGLYDDIEPGNLPYAVLVRRVNGHRMAALVDISSQQAEERRLTVLLTVVVVLGLSGLLLATWWLAGRLLRPVSELIERVRALDPSQRETRVVTDFPQREIRALESAFNDFLRRLDGFVLREREFIDTASHELRTPIAVIAGAAEVLQTEPLSDQGHNTLQRIRHTAGDMEAMLGVLLHLAKEPNAPAAMAPLALEAWLPALVDDYRPLLLGKPLTLELGPLEPTTVRVTPTVAAMVFGNLLRNAIEHTPAGRLQIALDDGVFSIETSGEPLDAAAIARLYRAVALAETGRASGAGIGLYLVQRLCERLGWTLAHVPGVEGDLRVTVDLRTRPKAV